VSHTITLAPGQRATLLRYYRGPADPRLRLRVHILLLLDDGRPWGDSARALYCSTRTIARWQRRFRQAGLAALRGQPPGPARRLGVGWAAVVVTWALHLTPRAFGLLRSRWCCQALAFLLGPRHRVAVSRETVRRWLRRAGPGRAGLAPAPPRPEPHRPRPRGDSGWRAGAAARPARRRDDGVPGRGRPQPQPGGRLPVDGAGRQAPLPTPGDNAKCHLAGLLHWRTGVLFQTVGPRRDGALFVRHLDELRRRLRRYRKVHVICDNAKFHKQGAVVRFLKEHGERVVLHYLPRYAPECNPVELVWWRLREAITRNHRCQSLPELVDLVLAWLTERKAFRV
jgi:transposase